MKHLSPEVLGALLDGALTHAQRAEAERHLELCAGCQSSLASLVAQDERTLKALEHDPGEAYFESFAGRVAARLDSKLSPLARLSRPHAWAWWHALWTPRGLAFAGSAAALTVVGVLALVQSQSARGVLTQSPLAKRAEQQAPASSRERAGAMPEAERLNEAGSPVGMGRESDQPAPRQLAQPEAKKSVPQASAFAASPEAASAPALESPGDQASESPPVGGVGGRVVGEARREAAPTAQQSVTQNGVGEELPSRARREQDVAPSDHRVQRDAAPARTPGIAPKPATSPASGSEPATGGLSAAREELLRSLKGRGASPLERQGEGSTASRSAKLLAPPPSTSAVSLRLDESVAGFEWPASLRPQATRAESLASIAQAGGAATAHDAAAIAWERLRESISAATPARLEAHARAAEARYAAWSLDPTTARSNVARGELSSLLGMLAQGPRRRHFETMLLRVREGAGNR